MRNEDTVNEHRRLYQQHRGSNGAHITLQDSFLPVEPLWIRLKERYFKWEQLSVAGRTIEKGWVIPQGLGIALCILILGGISGLYWRMTDRIADQTNMFHEQRELLIRLDQRLLDKNEHDNQRFQELKQAISDTQAHQAAVETVTNKEIAQLKAKVK